MKRLVASAIILLIALTSQLKAQLPNSEATATQRELDRVHQQAATAPPILPQEARNHVGENASVRGLVEQVSFSRKGTVFVNFGDPYPRHVFTAVVRASDVDRVGGVTFLRSLHGNPVTITGTIELYKGKPEIVITSPEQIEKGVSKPTL